MWHKTQKVTLKADIFKNSRTPQKRMFNSSRSPIIKKITTPNVLKKEDNSDLNELFQKVCCPNCRFLFKIIKNNVVTNASTFDKQIKQKSEIGSQTDDIQKDRLSFIKIKEQLAKESHRKNSILTNSYPSIQEWQKYSDGGESIRLRNTTNYFEDFDKNKVAVKVNQKNSSKGKGYPQTNRQREASIQRSRRNSIAISEKWLSRKAELQRQLTYLVTERQNNRSLLNTFQQLYTEFCGQVDIAGYKKMLFQSLKQEGEFISK